MSEPRPVLLWSAVALAAVACEPQPPRARPAAADREVIASRLVDALAGAAVTVGDFERSTAPREEDLLDWREGAQLGAPWVALDGGGRAPRGSATDSGQVVLHETACTVVPAGPEQRLRLRAVMGLEGTGAEGLGPGAVAGTPVAVELDARPASTAEGCSGRFLVAHGLAPRVPEAPSAGESGGTASHEVAFTTMSQTRAVAVLLVSGLRIGFGLVQQLERVDEARARVASASLARTDLRGMPLAELRDRFPPDPLLPPDPHGILLKPSLDRWSRDAIAAPPGTRVCWPVELAPGSALRLALGVAWAASSQPGRPVTFRVAAGGETLFEEGVGPERTGWMDRRVPLGHRSGAEEICFETEGEEGLTWAFWGSPALLAPADGEARRPETIVLVSIDTLRADRLGLYGYEPPTSPVIDALGAEGLVLEEHVAQTGWTLPSHVSMLTGLTPEAHGVTGQMDRVLEMLETGFDPSLPTLAAALRRAGYATHGVVSGPYLDPAFGFDRGFDGYDASTVSSHLRSHRDRTSEAATRLASRIVGAGGRAPLFLFVHYWDVHYDYLPAEQDLAAVHPELASRPIDDAMTRHPFTRHIDPALARLVVEAGLDRGPLEFYRRVRTLLPRYPRVRLQMALMSALYDGEVRGVDRHLGELLGVLERTGRGDALVVVTADHGESFLEHGTLGHGVDNIHREGLVVPLVVRAPGLLEPGRRREPSSTVDISATVLDLAGLPPLEGGQGRSLRRAGGRPGIAVGHDGSFQRVQATLGRHRLLVWGLFGPDELFDLERDPLELTDLGEAAPEVRARLRLELARYLLAHGRGVHVAVVGRPGATPFDVVLEADEVLRPAFGYGPPDSAVASVEEEGRRLRLRASPADGQVVAVTVLVPDDLAVRASVRDHATGSDEAARVGGGEPLGDGRADERWRLEPGALPDGLGDWPGAVHLWRTEAGTGRRGLQVQEETREQLRALGYIR